MQKWIDPSSTIWSYSMSSGVLLIQKLKPDEFLFVTLSKVRIFYAFNQTSHGILY